MKNTVRFLFVTIVVLWAVGSAGCAGARPAAGTRFFDVAAGRVLEADRLLPWLQGRRVVLVGEHHTVPEHHRAQLEVIRRLHEAGGKVAVGLEMFRNDSQEALDRWVAGSVDEAAFEDIYRDNWNYDWSHYAPIFRYARQQGIAMVGLNVPREITRQVARGGFASLSASQRRQLGDVACRVDPKYMEFIRKAHGAHGHGQISFTYFCEAQMVWDSAMAVNALAYLAEHPERAMVILTGAGHAAKQALPTQIRTRSDLAVGVILPGPAEQVSIEEADLVHLP